MVLLTAFQNLDSTTVHADAVVAIRYRDPAFRTDFDEEGVQADIIDENQRITDHVDAWRQDQVLSGTLKIHDGALVHTDDLEVADLTFDHVVAVVFGE